MKTKSAENHTRVIVSAVTAALCFIFIGLPAFATEINEHITRAAEIAKDDPRKAIEAMDAASKEHPLSGEIVIFRGMIYYDKLNDYSRSNADFYNGVILLGDNPEKEKYLELIDELTATFSSHEVFDFFNRSYSLIEIGDFPRAIELLNMSVSLQTNNARLYYELAYAYVEMNDYENAIKNIEASHRLNPVSMNILEEMKFLYVKTGKVDKLRSTITSIQNIYGQDPTLSIDLAQGYITAKDDKGTVAVLLEAIKTYPDYSYSYYTLGEFYYNKGQTREAIPYLNKYIEIASGMDIEDPQTRLSINKNIRRAREMAEAAGKQ